MIRVEGDEFYHMTRVLRLNVNDRYDVSVLLSACQAIIFGLILVGLMCTHLQKEGVLFVLLWKKSDFRVSFGSSLAYKEVRVWTTGSRPESLSLCNPDGLVV